MCFSQTVAADTFLTPGADFGLTHLNSWRIRLRKRFDRRSWSCEWLSRSALFWLLSAALIPLVHQFRMTDPSQRGSTLIEQASDELMEEVRTRVAAVLD